MNLKDHYKAGHFKELWRAKAVLQWWVMKLIGLPNSHAEQKLYREYMCPECATSKNCITCDCNSQGLFMAPAGRCSKRRDGKRKWGKMMSDEKWEEYKEERGIHFAVVDEEYEFQKTKGLVSLKDIISPEVNELVERNKRLSDQIMKLKTQRKMLGQQVGKKHKTKIAMEKEIEKMGVKIEEIDVDLETYKEITENIDLDKIDNDMLTLDKLKERELKNFDLIQDKLFVGEADGKVLPGKTYSYFAKYTGDLQIAGLRGSCGCQNLKLKDRGFEGTISITSDLTKVKSGLKNKEIYVKLTPIEEYYVQSRTGEWTGYKDPIEVVIRLEYVLP